MDHIAFKTIAMHFGRKGLPREIFSLSKQLHFCFSRGNSYCHNPMRFQNALQKTLMRYPLLEILVQEQNKKLPVTIDSTCIQKETIKTFTRNMFSCRLTINRPPCPGGSTMNFGWNTRSISSLSELSSESSESVKHTCGTCWESGEREMKILLYWKKRKQKSYLRNITFSWGE